VRAVTYVELVHESGTRTTVARAHA